MPYTLKSNRAKFKDAKGHFKLVTASVKITNEAEMSCKV